MLNLFNFLEYILLVDNLDFTYLLDYITKNAIIVFFNKLKSYLVYILACLKINLILNLLKIISLR